MSETIKNIIGIIGIYAIIIICALLISMRFNYLNEHHTIINSDKIILSY